MSNVVSIELAKYVEILKAATDKAAKPIDDAYSRGCEPSVDDIQNYVFVTTWALSADENTARARLSETHGDEVSSIPAPDWWIPRPSNYSNATDADSIVDGGGAIE